MALSTGTRLGPYEIVAAIGSGGMGEVYRARDPRLGRDVAIKVLPEHLSSDPQALVRFERESKAVAALSHPNILAIFDVGTEQGISYSVTELLEGETLRGRLRRGPIAWRSAVEIARALADGLAAAHSKAIVHRDLKPENVFLTAENRVKILDFGVARFQPVDPAGPDTSHRALTEDGMRMGTIGYMSPEQVRGSGVGPGSDIFALGCVLYEMISTRRPFPGETSAEIISAILRDSPAPLTVSGFPIPTELERLINHCLEKDPGERFQSARDLAYDLRTLLESTTNSPTLRGALRGPQTALHSIAVLPFANASRDPDTEYLCDGISESIINTLAQIHPLRVTPRSTVFRYKGMSVDPQAAGREMDVRVVLAGRIVQRGETLVVGAELIDVIEGTQLWGERYNRKLADIFELEEEIARKISESLRMKLTGEDKQRLAKRYTEDSEAYQLYLKGRHFWVKRTPAALKKAQDYFQQAIEKDRSYALAYAGLADSYNMLGVYGVSDPQQSWQTAKAAADRAVTLDPELAEAHTSLAFLRAFGEWDWDAAEAECRRAIELNPNYWVAPFWYAVICNCRGHEEEAARQIARAQQLEPVIPIIFYIAAWLSISGRRYDEAIERCTRGLDLDKDNALVRLWLGTVYGLQSRHTEAIRELSQAVRMLQGEPNAVGPLGYAYAMAGNRPEAQRVLDGLLLLGDRRYVDPSQVSLIYTGLGEKDRALEWLEKACAVHAGFLSLCITGDPRLDPLRSDPRFTAVLRRMRLDS